MLKVGDKIGMLALLEKKRENKRTYFWCKCDCGTEKWIRAEQYNREESTLRRAIKNGLLEEGKDCKKFGKQWVILKSSMERVYIKERKGLRK